MAWHAHLGLAVRATGIYTSTIGAAQAAWSAVRARCIFSASLNESTLQQFPGAPSGKGAGLDDGRAGMRWPQRVTGYSVSVVRSVFDDLMTTAFPSDCRVCNGPLLRASMVPICDVCHDSVLRQEDALCAHCGEALDVDMESARVVGQPAKGLLCHVCRAVPPMFERAVAYATYRDELREMIHLLKYERMRE